jgi:hypothetical protein
MSIIDKVKPLIDKLLSTDFRIAKNVIEEILHLSTKNLSGNPCLRTAENAQPKDN